MNVDIITDDGSEYELLHLHSTVDEEFGKMDMARIYVTRDGFNTTGAAEGTAEVYLTTSDDIRPFGGVLRDVLRHGRHVELVVDSFERYAVESEPSTAATTFEDADDSTVVESATNNVSSLSAGRVATIATGLGFTFAHASPGKQIRDVERVTTGEVNYTADKRVEYVQRRGRDKTNVTLSPSSKKISDGLTVERIGDARKVTHLRMLGAGQGEYQLTEDVIADSYTEGERERWGIQTNKDVSSPATLSTLGETLIAELNTEYIEAMGTVVDQDVSLGDEFHVVHPEEEIDADLRAVRVKTRRDSDGTRYECTFSSRLKSRGGVEEKFVEDIERYNKAIDGVAVPINASGGRSTVDDGFRYRMKFYYPSDVVSELRLNVRVSGLPYRDASGGTVSESSDYPANCDVLVNGDSLGVAFGDGTGSFQETVDISGELDEGAFNTVDITSESLGDLRAWVEGDVYRQLLTTG